MHVLCPTKPIIIDGIRFFITAGARDWYKQLLCTIGKEIALKPRDDGSCRVDWYLFQRLDDQKREEAVHLLVAVNILLIQKEGNCEIVNPKGNSLMPTIDGMPTFFNAQDRANIRIYCSSFPNTPIHHLFRVRVWSVEGSKYTDIE